MSKVSWVDRRIDGYNSRSLLAFGRGFVELSFACGKEEREVDSSDNRHSAEVFTVLEISPADYVAWFF